MQFLSCNFCHAVSVVPRKCCRFRPPVQMDEKFSYPFRTQWVTIQPPIIVFMLFKHTIYCSFRLLILSGKLLTGEDWSTVVQNVANFNVIHAMRSTWFRGTRLPCYETAERYCEHFSWLTELLHFEFGLFRTISRIYISTFYWTFSSPNRWRKCSSRTILRVAGICVRIWKIETILHLIHGNRLDCLQRTSQLSNEFNGFRLYWLIWCICLSDLSEKRRPYHIQFHIFMQVIHPE